MLGDVAVGRCTTAPYFTLLRRRRVRRSVASDTRRRGWRALARVAGSSGRRHPSAAADELLRLANARRRRRRRWFRARAHTGHGVRSRCDGCSPPGATWDSDAELALSLARRTTNRLLECPTSA